MFDVKEIRKDFLMLKNNPGLVYLDNGATTLKPKCVIDVVTNYYTHNTTNIHRGDYTISATISKEYELVRKQVATFIHATSEKEIVFTSGATQALNLVANSYKKFINEGDVILTTMAEHASNILPWFDVCLEKKAEVAYIPLNEGGRLTLDNFKKALTNKVKVVVLAHITNVLGYAVPIKEITKLAHEVGAIVICDGAQAIPHVVCDVVDWDVDFLAFSGHKCCAPTGVGVLYGKYDLLQQLDPYTLGGGSNARFDKSGEVVLKNAPYKFEAGTPAIEATLGLGKALTYLSKLGMQNIENYEKELKAYCIAKLSSLDHVIVYNPDADSGIIAFNIKDIFAQDVAAYLNSKGIAVRSGNHCAKILPEILATTETIRASFYFYNTFEEVDFFVQALSEITLESCIDLYL